MSKKNEEILLLWSELFVSRPIAIKKVEEKMALDSPLGLDEYDLLLIISREPEMRCRLNLITEKTLYSKSGVTRVVNRMLESGYLKKTSCPEDKRGQYASLTNEGIKALKKSWDIYSKAIIETLGPCLNRDEVKQLTSLLSKLIDQLRNDNIVSLPGKKLQ
ncbi:MAG TPA: MarR family transcriptional regulator [Oligoflexia bacterium]|nr:MarR family transcriptional regulator [Oligoflexia bacterium]